MKKRLLTKLHKINLNFELLKSPPVLQLTLATREDRGIPEDDNWTDVRQHEDLMCIFVEYELRKFNVSRCSDDLTGVIVTS